MFGTILLSICTVMHLYVFWRAATVPLVVRYLPRTVLVAAGAGLWALFVLGRTVGHDGRGAAAALLEFAGMGWMAVLFLTFLPLLVVDILTLYGWLFPRLSPRLRGVALGVGLALSVAAAVQGMRPPVVERYEVALSGLPAAMDGTVLVALSDMHLGALLGERWLSARIAQVRAQRPDLVVLLGDIFEGHGPPEGPLLERFAALSAPLGTYAVAGNHEFHGGGRLDRLEKTGFALLRNRWAAVGTGLVLAGVDDLTSLRRRGRDGGDAVRRTLAGRPDGAVVLLSHTPWEAETAAESGAGLMLSGHTHGGQIWPFGYLVRKRYPLLAGRYEVGGMTVIVCRGTGTWGPRMRLWRPGEILRVTLRSAPPQPVLERTNP